MEPRESRSLPAWLEDATRIDHAVYAAVARTPSPTLDRAMRGLSSAADLSKLNVAVAGVLAVAGGSRGRRAARDGLVAIGVASAVINTLIKPVAKRGRPDRAGHEVPDVRHVPMPTSRSLPSGHTASAFALATAAGHVLPQAAGPLRLFAALVGYSRVHTGVHYPGDVVLGALLGTTLAQATAHVLERT